MAGRVCGDVRVRYLNILISVLFFSLLCSCSNTRLVYNYLDWIIGWRMDDYFALNRVQEDFYKTRLHALLKWHRREQLPRYSDFIAKLQGDLARGMTVGQLRGRYQTLKEFWRDITIKAGPDCSDLMLSLDTKQRQYFYRAWEKEQRKFEEKYLKETLSERQQRLRRRMEKTIQRFAGRLTGPQKVMVENWSLTLLPMQRLWLKNRADWMMVLKETLESDDTDIEKKEILRRLLVDPEQQWHEAYREMVFQNEQATLEMLDKMVRSLREKQKKHLDKVLERLKKDCAVLAAQ